MVSVQVANHSGFSAGSRASCRARVTAVVVAFFAALVGCDEPEIRAQEPMPRAADYRSATVEGVLDRASKIVRTRGFVSKEEPFRGFLIELASEIDEASMSAGTCYVIVAATSPAMRELDLRLFDSDGADVAADTMTGPHAALQYCPSQSGTYYVAARASAGSGLFAIRVFSGPAGLNVPLDDVFGPNERELAKPVGK